MKKHITLQNKKIVYTLRKSRRARRMRLAVYCDGSVVITTPLNLQETVAENFIKDKMGWLFSKISFFNQFRNKPIARYSHHDYLKYKESAYNLVRTKVDHFSRLKKYRYGKIRIKNQKTCWGSCSKKGNLNFNYKILFLPDKIQNYIVIHELCHLKEFNHSKKFWGLVAGIMPDYFNIRKEIKKIGMGLN